MNEKPAYKTQNDVEIAINNVSVVFKDNGGNDVKALDNVDFDIHKGEFISLLGPSGCGKTTLLRTIADLLEPTSGNVRVSGMTPKEIRLLYRIDKNRGRTTPAGTRTKINSICDVIGFSIIVPGESSGKSHARAVTIRIPY